MFGLSVRVIFWRMVLGVRISELNVIKFSLVIKVSRYFSRKTVYLRIFGTGMDLLGWDMFGQSWSKNHNVWL